MKAIIFLSALLPLFLMSSNAIAQSVPCSAPDITVSTDVTWQNQTIYMQANRKIIITEGATLTIKQCTLRRPDDCVGYWDGIYLVTSEEGKKASLYVEESVIEFSQRGIQAKDGWEHIELVSTKMRDNGQMINVRDNWPLPPFSTIGGGGLKGGDSSELTTRSNVIKPERWGLDGEGGGGEEGCEYLPAPKVIISDHCQMLVTEIGNPSIDPFKRRRQVSVLGGELIVSNSNFVNGQDDRIVTAISASRGKCQIYGTIFEDFWLSVYKGSDAQANCTSEGLILTGSFIKNPHYGGVGNGSYGVYNVSSNMLVERNIIENAVWSQGISYGSISNNNLYNPWTGTTTYSPTVQVSGPEESFKIHDNRLYDIPSDFFDNNVKTDVTCNNWVNSVYAVGASGLNQFPISWGTLLKSSGNIWDQVKSEMLDYSLNSNTLNYYYYVPNANEAFAWTNIISQSATDENDECSYTYPWYISDLDTTEYILSSNDLEVEYHYIDSLIEDIKSTSDTTQTTVQEEIAELERQLSHIVGKGVLFMDSTNREFWTEKLNTKVIELAALNSFWYAHNLDTIKSLLISHSEPDAQVLYDAASVALNYIDSSDLYSLSVSEVSTLDSIARSSYGDYTNLLRNFLYMVYDSLIPWERESVLDSIREAESFSGHPTNGDFTPELAFSVFPNPFTENIEITNMDAETEESQYSVQVLTLDGRIVKAGSFNGRAANLTLSHLEPGFYFVKIVNTELLIEEVHKIYKSTE